MANGITSDMSAAQEGLPVSTNLPALTTSDRFDGLSLLWQVPFFDLSRLPIVSLELRPCI